jgi:peroxiredoxin
MKHSFTKLALAGLAVSWMAWPTVTRSTLSNATPTVAVSTNFLRRLRPFVLKDLAGQEVKYAETFTDKLLLLVFFTSSAQPCQDQAPALVALQQEHGGKGFSVVGISLDAQGGREVRAFAQRNKVNFPILFGDLALVQDVGGVTAVPTLCLVDQNRMLIMKEAVVMSKETLDEVLKAVRKNQQ